jgi:hypothetical protein
MVEPAARYWPSSTCRIPNRPANGALTTFSSINACCASTCARADFSVAASESSVAWLMAWAANCSWSRL